MAKKLILLSADKYDTSFSIAQYVSHSCIIVCAARTHIDVFNGCCTILYMMFSDCYVESCYCMVQDEASLPSQSGRGKGQELGA